MKDVTLKLPGEKDFFTQEAFKALRTNIQFCGQDVHTILVTSCQENEGKTTVTLQIGKSFAELGKKVLVIDADMRISVIAGRNARVTNPPGLSEALSGIEKVSECMYKTQYPGYFIMFAGKYPPNPVELLSGKYFTSLLKYCRETFDYILIDTPPLGDVIDAAVVASQCDGAILVISDLRIHRSEARDVVDQLKKTGCSVLGVVRNNVRKNDRAYYRKKYY